jgi:hypothetical protein
MTMVEINDPNTSLEDLPPVALVEVDGPGDQPPPEWGRGGETDGE